MTGYVPASLQRLEERAGASDQDRGAWMEERAHAATATAVRDVWLAVQQGKSIEDAADAIARKRLAEKPRARGREARWGTDREAALIATIPGMRFESRVFHHPTELRWKASPDGIAFDFEEQLEIGEVKTGKPEFYGLAGMAKKGYHVQMAWSMFIAAAVRARYRFEERLGTRHEWFAPGQMFGSGRVFSHTIEWADVAELVHEELVPMARALVDAIDALLDAGMPEVREDVDVEAVRYLHALDEEKRTAEIARAANAAKKSATEAKEAAYAKVRELAGSGAFSQESLLAKVTKGADTATEIETRVVDDEHVDVVAARAAVVDAQAVLDAVIEQHTTVSTEAGTKQARLTITSPLKRKGKS